MNRNLFRAAYIAKGYNQETFAKAMNLTTVTIHNKEIKDGFTAKEIMRIAELLDLSREQVTEIFLDQVGV